MNRASIRKEILSWKSVIEKPNRFGTPSFFLKGKEFAHFHSDSQMDIRKPKNFTHDKRTQPNPDSNEWIWFNFKVKTDAEDMVAVVRKIYDEIQQ